MKDLTEMPTIEPVTENSLSIYNTLFDTLATIDSGCFGTVYKVKHKLDDELYAVKCVQLNEDFNTEYLEEIKNLAKVRSEYVVQYYNSWTTGVDLYIQMELCSGTLRHILDAKPQAFSRKEGQPLKTVEYFISSEMFRELLECVQYLHGLQPPVHHRDLKPENILIAKNVRNGRFIKLGDFGLSSTLDKTVSYGSWDRYMLGAGAPKSPDTTDITIDNKHVYRDRVDVLALGRLGHEIFDTTSYNINIKTQTPNVILNTKLAKLKSQLDSMSDSCSNNRPECSQVLAKYSEWAVDRNLIRKYRERLKVDFDLTIARLKASDEKFFYDFMRAKYYQNKCNSCHK